MAPTKAIKKLLCKDIMNSKLISLAPHESVIRAIEIMQEHHIRHLPIIENNQAVGILSDRDTRQVLAILQVMGITIQKARGDLRVSEFMASPVETVDENVLAVEAAQIMIDHKIGCLPVTNGKTIIGIITETDIMQQFIQDHHQ